MIDPIEAHKQAIAHAMKVAAKNPKASDKHYLAWLRTQQSPFPSNSWQDGEICNDPAHIRCVAFGSAMAIKPPFSAVPLSHEDHAAIQHQSGYGKLLQKYGYCEGKTGFELKVLAQDWFAKQARIYLLEWLRRFE